MIKDVVFKDNFARFGYRIALWHIKYLIYKKASPLACGFYLTSKCNFHCDFCNIWRVSPNFQISEEKAREIIHDLGRMGLVYFSFSGGEPLLVPYVFDLLSYAKKVGVIYTHIVSNGYLMDRTKARLLAGSRLSEISFSIDGDKESHDAKRGIAGAFEKVITAIDNVKSASPKTNIVVNTILDPHKPEDAVFAVKLAEDLGVKIKVQPLNDHPCFGNDIFASKKRLLISPEEKKRLMDAIDLIQGSDALVNSRAFLDNYKFFMFCPERIKLAKEDCIFGFHHLEVFNNMAFPCLEGLNWKAGFDLSNRNIKEIIRTDEYSKKLAELKKCSGCKRNYYICYYEPRLNFPVWNFIKTRLNRRIEADKC